MALNSILNIATSGLYASQSGIKNVSQNIANVNTKGYVRIEQEQSAVNLNGGVGGVSVTSIRRAADKFLQSATIAASTSAAKDSIKSQYLDQVQTVFGDPTGDSSLFTRIDEALGTFETAVLNPGSMSIRRDVLSKISNVLAQLGDVSDQVQDIRGNVDYEIASSIDEMNSILDRITKVNSDITRGNIQGDANGAKEELSSLIDRLSEYIDIRADFKDTGVANIYTHDGTFLAGFEASKFSYTPSGGGMSVYNPIYISFGSDTNVREIDKSIQGGKIRGLMDLRNSDLADIADNLGEFAGKFADALNAVHNTNATLPAPSSLTGEDTGLIAGDALNFTGQTTIAIVDTNGAMQRKIAIDFNAGTLSVNGGASVAFGTTIGGFTASLNAAMGGLGTASFANGKLSMTSTNAGQGIIFEEPKTGGSLRGDRSFPHFFGLNNIVTSSQPTNFATGLSATDAHGFTPGGTFTLKLNDASGQEIVTRQITVPAGNWGNIISSMNSAATGLGLYGTFGFDAAGRMQWSANASATDFNLVMTEDLSPRGTTNLSFGQITGLNQDTRATRAAHMSINTMIAADPRKLGLAKSDIGTSAIGDVIVGMGDSNGAQDFFSILDKTFTFSASLGSMSRKMTLGEFSSALGGDIGVRAKSAETQKDAALALKDEAVNRRSNQEGVNLDEELIKLTTYQQSYAAAARMIKAADEMYQTLLDAV